MDKQKETNDTKEIQVGNITVDMHYDSNGKSLEECIIPILQNYMNHIL